MTSPSEIPIKVAVIGVGTRGTHLAQQLTECEVPAQIVAVAEPNVERREAFARAYTLPERACFPSWQALCENTIPCDAVIIATLDNQHTEPALAALSRGWHILLEKPMADTFEGCLAIDRAQREAGMVVAVCHSLRYMPGFRRVKAIVQTGVLGEVIHIEHMEAIGHLRFTHNYVRGKWAREANNTFLLLHKCCHDLDFIQWLIPEHCERVTSFGSLSYFIPSHAPAGSGTRCINDCAIQSDCPYSAVRLYVESDLAAWPARDICTTHTREAHLAAITHGPFGACVWRAGNDVVDHQAVTMEFANGATATCTLSGYSATNGRRTRVQGTHGELLYDEASGEITVGLFAKSQSEILKIPHPTTYHPEDKEIVGNWLAAIRHTQDKSEIVNPQQALKSHTIVFAAERSRKEKREVETMEFYRR